MQAFPLRAYVSFLLVAVLGCVACSSISAAIPDQMDHRRWTASDDGPGSVGALAQTADGYLWLGTNDSLYRFDGFEFEKFVPADGEPLGMVSALLSTANGLWVGFRAGGARFITANDVLQPLEPGIPGGIIYGMAEDQQGQVWIAADGGLARHDGVAWHGVGQEAGFGERHARAVHVDAEGHVWAASEEQLYMLTPGASAFTPIDSNSQSISKIVSSPAGEIWVADRAMDHLLRLRKTGNTDVEVEEIPTSSAVSMVLDEQGGIWLGTLGAGVHHLAAEEQNPVSSYTFRDGLSSDNVLSQLIDRDGILWLGTDAGLDRLKRKTLSPLALPGGAGGRALAVSGDGSLWIGSGAGQLTRTSGDSDSMFELDMPITTMINSEEYGLLIGGHRGIFSLSGNVPTRIASLPVESAREAAVRAIAVGTNGDLWVSVNRAGLFVWSNQHWRRTEPVSDSERQVMPVTASRDLAGTLWFGYRDNLLVSVDEQETERWDHEKGLDIGHVTAILHVPGRTWVGGQHGLAYLEDGRFHRLDLPAAGAFQNIYGLVGVPASNGAHDAGMDIWVHSRGGIFKLPATEVERVIAGGNTLLYSAYHQAGRLPVDPFRILPLPTAVYTPEGSLWFTTEYGVVRVDPHSSTDMRQPSIVSIKRLMADGVDFDITATPVQLSSAPQRLVIAYSALNLFAPETMRFQYRLRGHDPEWIDAGRARQAVFPRLRPGDYEFQVRALGDNENLNLPGAALTISIPQVFYLRPGFLLIVSATLLALVFWMSRVYARREKSALRTRLEERFQERERIARELHDTLLQSVQGMMLSFQAVADSLPGESRARHSMERALDRAEQVIAEGRDRITGLRGQMSPSEDLPAAFQALPLDIDLPSSAAYSVSHMGEPVPLRNEVRDAFYQVGREAVFNAFRHAQASQISVSFNYVSDTFEMLIVDDGIGIEPLYQRLQGRPEHGGLRGMYERAERIAATLTIFSNAENGTRVGLSLPGSLAYTHTNVNQAVPAGRG